VRAIKCWRPGKQAPEKAPGRPQRHTCTARNNAGGDEKDETREEKRGEDKEGDLSPLLIPHGISSPPESLERQY